MKNLAILMGLVRIEHETAGQSIVNKGVTGQITFKAKEYKKAPKRIYINSFNSYFEVFGNARASTTGGESCGRVKGTTNVAMECL